MITKQKNVVQLIFVCILLVAGAVIHAQEDNYLIKKLNHHNSVVTALAFNKNGTVLASASKDKDLVLISTENWETNNTFSNYFAVDNIKFTTDETLLYTSGKAIKYIDLENKELDLFEGSPTYVLSVDYSLKQNKLIGASYNKQIWVWDIRTSSLISELEGHTKNAQTAAISSSLPLAVSGSVDGSIRVWDLDSTKTKFLIENHVKAVYDVEFHPNGKYFLSCSADNYIRLWNATTGSLIKAYTGHKEDVVQVAFTSDGEHFFSASADGTVILWQTRTGKSIYSFIDHEGMVTCLAASPNNKYLATGGADGDVFVYNIDKKVYVVANNEDAYMQFKTENTIFEDKQRGEKKEDFALRMQKAASVEHEWVEKEYQKYISTLKTINFTDEEN